MKNNITELAKYLEQEISWIDELNTLLNQEKNMLTTCQFTQLEELANQKQEISNQLENSAKQRLELIKGTTNQNQSIKDFLKQCNTEEALHIHHLNNTLKDKLIVCRELNTVNGQVIANNIHTRQEIVNTLSGNHINSVSVYTSTGDMKTSNDTNHHQEA